MKSKKNLKIENAKVLMNLHGEKAKKSLKNFLYILSNLYSN